MVSPQAARQGEDVPRHAFLCADCQNELCFTLPGVGGGKGAENEPKTLPSLFLSISVDVFCMSVFFLSFLGGIIAHLLG